MRRGRHPSPHRYRSHARCPQHVETAEFVPEALCRSCDGILIRDLELEGAGIRSDAPPARLHMLEVARSDEHGEAAGREALRDLPTDPLLAPATRATGLSCIVISFLPQGHISF